MLRLIVQTKRRYKSKNENCVKMWIEVTKQDDYFLSRCGVRDVRHRSCHTEEDTTHHSLERTTALHERTLRQQRDRARTAHEVRWIRDTNKQVQQRFTSACLKHSNFLN